MIPDNKDSLYPWVEKGAPFVPTGITHEVNFATTPSFEDPTMISGVANMCVVVLTSDGNLGTLTHLTVTDNPNQFAEKLKQSVGKAGVPVCLVGGSSRYSLDDTYNGLRFIPQLILALSEYGFTISESPDHNDLLGDFDRHVTLYPDRVEVRKRKSSSRDLWELSVLTFPKQ